MAETVNNLMPWAECPYCRKDVQLEDWYDLKEGESRYCPACKRPMKAVRVEPVMYVAFSTED